MYDHKEIEKKWQQEWQDSQIYKAQDDSGKPKKYILIEFPYPSGEGLHMGHLRPYVAGDVYSRFFRMRGFETMYPIGWDAFGLPAENFAIKKGVHPRISTAKNIENAKRQINSWGIGFDWSRELNTTNPDYYKWTQWIFLQFFKTGLAYEATGLINWCPKDKTGLANEEVIDGKCERCGSVVEKKELRQWYLKITEYAEKLLEGLDTLEWPEPVKSQQKNWIGKSVGAQLIFAVTDIPGQEESKHFVEVFTTRPDTIYGATFIVISPELAKKWIEIGWKAPDEVRNYVASSLTMKEQDRTAIGKEKTGVDAEIKAINPATGQKIPVWVADYVLGNYGTGAIMAVPAHDDRDYKFARKYGLGIIKVIKPDHEFDDCYEGEGMLINSGEFTGESSSTARPQMAIRFGTPKVQYKIRDWVFSRQRYWGEPIPIIHCPTCGVVPVPEEQLPVLLPEVEKYEPTGTGESPLAAIDEWVNVKCPKCEGDAKRETNTMPQWAGSSWYWIRYTDPANADEFAAKDLQKYWTPVDTYFGGMEHTTLHLLYARFWNLFLYDQGQATAKEPFLRRIPHGIVLASDGEKMSKSRGNVVNPDEVVEKFGADTLRMYELFLGPHETQVSWNDQGIIGVRRFLEKVIKFQEAGQFVTSNKNMHKLIKKVTSDIENIKFNTAISAFMEFMNENKQLSISDWDSFLKLLAPFAPHIAEELWHQRGHKESIHLANWPEFEEDLVKEEKQKIVVQINGKKKALIEVDATASREQIVEIAKSDPNVKKGLEGKNILGRIHVDGKLLNLVVENEESNK
jgi:leucyl-tRNA synthetase